MRADVAGQNDDGVLERHHPAAAVRQPAVVEDLQQQIEYVRMRLFNFVKQYDRIGLASDTLGELSAPLVKADVSRRRADKLGDRILLHIFGHIQPHEHLLVAEHTLGKRLGKIGLSHARRTYKNKGTNGFSRIFQPRTRTAYGFRDGNDRLLLTNDAAMQFLFEMHETFTLRFREFVDRHSCPAAYDRGDLFRSDRKTCRTALGIPLIPTGSKILGQRLDLTIQSCHACGIVPLCRLLAVGPEPRKRFLSGTKLFRSRIGIQPRFTCSLINEVDRLVRQKTVCDITVGKPHRCLDRRIRDHDIVMCFILIFDAAQNGDRVLDVWLRDDDRRKTPFERRIFFDVFSVLFQRSRANRLQFPARKHGL